MKESRYFSSACVSNMTSFRISKPDGINEDPVERQTSEPATQTFPSKRSARLFMAEHQSAASSPIREQQKKVALLFYQNFLLSERVADAPPPPLLCRRSGLNRVLFGSGVKRNVIKAARCRREGAAPGEGLLRHHEKTPKNGGLMRGFGGGVEGGG